jgi:hypothetical protein
MRTLRPLMSWDPFSKVRYAFDFIRSIYVRVLVIILGRQMDEVGLCVWV